MGEINLGPLETTISLAEIAIKLAAGCGAAGTSDCSRAKYDHPRR